MRLAKFESTLAIYYDSNGHIVILVNGQILNK